MLHVRALMRANACAGVAGIQRLLRHRSTLNDSDVVNSGS
eukprot:COSAG01_NODE_5527_length_4205_cov_2.387725_2_plen_40_part_00